MFLIANLHYKKAQILSDLSFFHKTYFEAHDFFSLIKNGQQTITLFI